MTTAVNNQTSQDVYSALGLNAPNSNATKKKNTLDQADFLRLMTEQLQHQDPLKPMDNTQMVAQMAQMSTVQGITDLNKTVKGFQESMASDQVLRGAALVGHQVLVPSEKLVLEKEGNVEGTVAAPSAGIITVDITDANGAKVTSLSVEAKAAGETAFQWDGKDANGKRMEPGKYSIVANHVDTAGKSTKLSTYVQAPVESVTVGSDGLYLNLKGLGTAPIDYVLRVRHQRRQHRPERHRQQRRQRQHYRLQAVTRGVRRPVRFDQLRPVEEPDRLGRARFQRRPAVHPGPQRADRAQPGHGHFR